jgi:hypothetical protein
MKNFGIAGAELWHNGRANPIALAAVFTFASGCAMQLNRRRNG